MSFEQDCRTRFRIPRRRMAHQPLQKQFSAMLEKINFHKMFGKVATAGKGNYKDTLKKQVQEGATKLPLKELAAGALGFMSNIAVPGSGLVAGGALYAGANLHGAQNIFAKAKKPEKVGDWVMIHHGMTQTDQILEDSLTWGAADLMKIKGREKLKKSVEERLTGETKAQPKVSIGFYIEHGEKESTYRVFDFGKTEIIQVRKDDVARLDPLRAATLNENVSLNNVKNFVLQCHGPIGWKLSDGKKLKSIVNVDPGSEVVYKDELFVVVSADGNKIRINDSYRVIDCDIQDLSPGRQGNNNSWNYGYKQDNSFDADSSAEFHAAQWVWLTPREISKADTKGIFTCTRELGGVRLMNGGMLDGYYAVDGVRFQTLPETAKPASLSETGWLNKSKDFARFMDSVSTGENVKVNRLGANHLSVCLGDVLEMDAVVEDITVGETLEGMTPGEMKTLVSESYHDEGQVAQSTAQRPRCSQGGSCAHRG